MGTGWARAQLASRLVLGVRFAVWRIQSAPPSAPHADRFMNLFSGRAVLLRERLPDRRLPWVRRVRARSEDRHPLGPGRRDAAVHHRHVP